jgi:hypothetical protein
MEGRPVYLCRFYIRLLRRFTRHMEAEPSSDLSELRCTELLLESNLTWE